MVYCGKPSKGCQTCRTRKIRCDQNPEGCSQCSKASKACPGYRVQLDLMFRNESDAVVMKAKAKEALKKHQVSHNVARTSVVVAECRRQQSTDGNRVDDYSRNVSPHTPRTIFPTPSMAGEVDNLFLERSHQSFPGFNLLPMGTPSSGPSIKPFLIDYATTFFIRSFVIGLGPSDSDPSTAAGYVSANVEPDLAAGMRAVGFAGFANIASAPEVMRESQIHYMRALRLTNAALRSPTDAIKDSTLLSIMILGLYETVTGRSQKSLATWAAHINGAGALIKMRGHQQLSTPSGLRMFIQVTSSLLISCVQRELPLPRHIVELREEASKFVDSNDPAWRVQGTVIEFVDFRAKMKERKITEPQEILEKALALDGKFLSIFEEAPLAWRCKTVYTNKDPTIVWRGMYQVYHDYWVAQIWNASRTCRILLNEVVRAQLLAGFAKQPPIFLEPIYLAQYQVSTDTLFQLRDDILASVPQHLGYAPAVSHALFSPTPSPSSRSASPPSPQVYTHPSQGHSDLSGDRASYVALDHALSTLAESNETWSDLPNHERIRCSDVMGRYSEGIAPPVPTTTTPRSSNLFFKPPRDSRSDAELPMLRGSGGYFLLWPLYLVGVMSITTDEVKEWAGQTLKGIGRTMGIHQAIALAGFLENSEEMKAWQRQKQGRTSVKMSEMSEASSDTRLDLDEVAAASTWPVE